MPKCSCQNTNNDAKNDNKKIIAHDKMYESIFVRYMNQMSIRRHLMIEYFIYTNVDDINTNKKICQ